MEMQFSASVITAIEGVLRLHEGKFKGVPAPIWCNFRFPSSLKASPIEYVKRNDPIPNERVGSWDLNRTVEFFYLGKRIATVFLTGCKLDGMHLVDNGSFWGVRKIRYLPNTDRTVDVESSIMVFIGDNLTSAPR